MDYKDEDKRGHNEGLPGVAGREGVSPEDWARYREAGKRLEELKKDIENAQKIFSLTAELIQVKYHVGKEDKIGPDGTITRVAEQKPQF
jgi:hypothetical protein